MTTAPPVGIRISHMAHRANYAAPAGIRIRQVNPVVRPVPVDMKTTHHVYIVLNVMPGHTETEQIVYSALRIVTVVVRVGPHVPIVQFPPERDLAIKILGKVTHIGTDKYRTLAEQVVVDVNNVRGGGMAILTNRDVLMARFPHLRFHHMDGGTSGIFKQSVVRIVLIIGIKKIM